MNNLGLSKNKVEIINGNNETIIKKSSTINADRLHKQYLKQNEFYHNKIKTPKVLNFQESNNYFSFTMEYINGLSFIDVCNKFIYEDVITKVNNIFSFIEDEFEHCIHKTVNKEIISKVESLRCLPIKYNKILNLINNYCKEHTIEIPVGKCHGDLTFANVLFTKENIYVIDFLDCYIETPLQDLTKVMQELNLRWSFLTSTKIKYDHVKVRMLYELLQEKLYYQVRNICKKFNINYTDCYLMYILTLLRILPYTSDEKIIAKIDEELKMVYCVL
jgi:tRNA A-37 threonylcarbamoyl transferase component Bud32